MSMDRKSVYMQRGIPSFSARKDAFSEAKQVELTCAHCGTTGPHWLVYEHGTWPANGLCWSIAHLWCLHCDRVTPSPEDRFVMDVQHGIPGSLDWLL